MQLFQARMVTGEVAPLAQFYSQLLEQPVVLNDYYVEIPAGAANVAFCKDTFSECKTGTKHAQTTDLVILDFSVPDVDGHFQRIDRLGVDWVLAPTTQPWGTRAMVLRDPEGRPVNIFSR